MVTLNVNAIMPLPCFLGDLVGLYQLCNQEKVNLSWHQEELHLLNCVYYTRIIPEHVGNYTLM